MDCEGSRSSYGTRRASSTGGAQRRCSSTGSAATAVGVSGENFNSLIVSFYTRTYPSAEAFGDDAAELGLEDIHEAVTELANEVSALREETQVLCAHAQALQQRRPGGSATVNILNTSVSSTASQLDLTDNGCLTDGPGAASSPVDATVAFLGGDCELAACTTRASGGGVNETIGSASGTSRRGRSYRRRSLADVDVFMRVDDKAALLRQETARLRAQEEKAAKEAEGVQEVLVATVEEAVRRQQELRLEVLQLEREVMLNGCAEDDTAEAAGTANQCSRFRESKGLIASSAVAAAATADELLRYLDRRHSSQVNYLDKLEVQCQAAEQDIVRTQQLVRQRRIAGEAFQAVDMEQLRIEHKQFSERMEAKNNELAELKGTSTRTVQQLNHLMGQLNELATEQTRLKREAKGRSEYLSRCGKEIATATVEAAQAESKHMTLKAQQEAVKVPKIEEYMAQKAEEVELEKAVKNWERKVQIAEGQATVVRQQSRRLQTQRSAAIKYANEKHQSRAATALDTASAAGKASPRAVVGGARHLLPQRHQQQRPLLTQESTRMQDESSAAPADQPAAAAGAEGGAFM
ncbi:hypothetical protein CUR178_04766 [Leishmania enriettii]|uniref:Cilia- and flagella-associated protein 263 n=1 Tax=Leishmania enriettii TaxID=5663 RepID=A0A836KZ32_LEIEN|nr:hypothetical protein CUR178_04766 [Leishmania enriettii]